MTYIVLILAMSGRVVGMGRSDCKTRLIARKETIAEMIRLGLMERSSLAHFFFCLGLGRTVGM